MATKELTTKEMTDPKTGVTLTVNNVPYGSYLAAKAANELDEWFWEEVLVKAEHSDGSAVDWEELDLASASSLIELGVTGLLGKKVRRRRG